MMSDAYKGLTLDDLRKLAPQGSVPPPPQRPAVCDPRFVAQRMNQVAPPGTPDDAKMGAVRDLLELYGCIPPQPPPPAPQTTTCIPLGGGMVTCTTQ